MKMRIFRTILLLVIFHIVNIKSGYTQHHLPGVSHIPITSENKRGFLRTSGSFTKNAIGGFELQYDQSLFKGILLAMDFRFMRSRRTAHKELNFALGYHYVFNENWTVEGLIGIGKGEDIDKEERRVTTYTYSDGPSGFGLTPVVVSTPTGTKNKVLKATYTSKKSYVQGNIGYNGKGIAIAFSSRLSIVNYTKASVGGILEKENYLEGFESGRRLFYEPALAFKLGSPKFRVVQQSQLSVLMGGAKITNDLFLLSLGFEISLNKK